MNHWVSVCELLVGVCEPLGKCVQIIGWVVVNHGVDVHESLGRCLWIIGWVSLNHWVGVCESLGKRT